MIEKKIEAVKYANMAKSNYISANKYGVSKWTIRYWASQLEDLENASKKKKIK